MVDDSKRLPGIPIFVDEADPEIDDPANSHHDQHWYPANTIAIKLVRCLEALRDIQVMLNTLAAEEDPASRKRLTKLLATPLFNLIVGVRDMFNDIEGNAKEYKQITVEDRRQINNRFERYLEEVPFDSTSTLKIIRDKISSHIDKDVFKGDARKTWSLVDLEQLLEWLRIALEALMFLLSLDIYAWTRDSGHEDVFRLMWADGYQVDLNLKETVIVGMSLARSPKYYISSKVQEMVETYNRLRSKYGGISSKD